jgi:hypothetical protein
VTVFDPKSRYASAQRYTVPDRRGRAVTVVSVPAPPRQATLGFHLLMQGQRLDALALRYLEDADAGWRIVELNDAMHPDWLAAARELAIPAKGR